MKKALLAIAASIPFIVVATAPAKALVPLVIAGIAVGSALFGLLAGNVVSNNNAYYNPPAAYVAPTPAVQPDCYLKRTHSGHLIRVC